MQFLKTVLDFVVTLGVLVFVHELGHFLAAKLCGMRVDRFSIGFPPRAFGRKFGETDYCVSWLPIGGYVKIAGMVDESMDVEFLNKPPEPWEFRSKPIWQRMIVLSAAIRRWIGRDNRGAGFQLKRNVALQMDGIRKIVARREEHRPPASGRGCIDRLVDGGRVDSFSVAGRAESPYVKASGSGGACGGVHHALVCGDSYGGAGNARTGIPQKVPAKIIRRHRLISWKDDHKGFRVTVARVIARRKALIT